MTSMYCPSCGAPTDPSDRFCRICGCRLGLWDSNIHGAVIAEPNRTDPPTDPSKVKPGLIFGPTKAARGAGSDR